MVLRQQLCSACAHQCYGAKDSSCGQLVHISVMVLKTAVVFSLCTLVLWC